MPRLRCEASAGRASRHWRTTLRQQAHDWRNQTQRRRCASSSSSQPRRWTMTTSGCSPSSRSAVAATGTAPLATTNARRTRIGSACTQLLSSPDFRGRWLAVVDDLPPPAVAPMEEAGLDWFYDKFPWSIGESVITTRASEWAQDTVCRVDGVNTQWDDGTSV